MTADLDLLISSIPIEPVMVHEVGLMLEPEEAFGRICRRPGSFFLDSSLEVEGLGRRSFMGCDPAAILRVDASATTLIVNDRALRLTENPFDVLRGLLDRFRFGRASDEVPFCGGMVGYIGYEMSCHIDRLPLSRMDDLRVPWMCMGLYRETLAVDHDTGRWHLVGPGADPARSQLMRWMTRGRLSLPDPAPQRSPGDDLPVSWNFTPEQFQDAVAVALHYIREGELRRINLSQRLSAPLLEHPWHIYTRLRRISPAPFSGYLNMPGVVLCSSSPARFIKVEGRRFQKMIIDKTRPSEASAGGGRASELAEAMTVALVREELSGVSEDIRVGALDGAQIDQLDDPYLYGSIIQATLRPDADVVSLLKAAFPSSSITGAPKIRAMQIIDELEPTHRGPYTGSIGYIGFDGWADLNIAIRTLVVAHDRVYGQVGAGVEEESSPESMYEQTLDGARPLIQTLERVGR